MSCFKGKSDDFGLDVMFEVRVEFEYQSRKELVRKEDYLAFLVVLSHFHKHDTYIVTYAKFLFNNCMSTKFILNFFDRLSVGFYFGK